jgi:glycosyltransferase involved in cell wall biosynthesis
VDAKHAAGARTLIYPNAMPFVARPVRKEDQAIVFTGNLEYQPNITAVEHFYEKIWPLLRARVPDLVWRIAGKNPGAIVRLLNGDPRVHVTGPMDDAIATLASAKVAVVPLLSGSGTRFKILEAWAAGTPVVSTSLGAEGLPANAGEHLLICDDPGEFAEAVAFLLEAPEARTQLAEAGRRLYETRHTWDVAWSTLDRGLSELMKTD